MKSYKKDKVRFENGYIMKKDSIVGVDAVVVKELNEIETMIQEFMYLDSQPDEQAAPSLEGFVRKSMHKAVVELEAPETPMMDKCVAEGLVLRDEILSMETFKAKQEWVEKHQRLLDWLDSKYVVEIGAVVNLNDLRFDTPTLGNPLELTPKKLLKLIEEC